MLTALMQAGMAWRMLAVGVVTAILVTLVPKIYRLVQKYRFFQSLPGEQDFSILWGNLHLIPSDGEKAWEKLRAYMTKFNPQFCRFWFGPTNPVIRVHHPETAKKVFQSSAPKNRGFGQVYEMVTPWVGEGLSVANGPSWHRARHLITPAFHFDILKNYQNVFNSCVDILEGKLDKLAETGEMFDMAPLMTLFTLDVILKCSMSYDVDLQSNESHPYATAVQELLSLWMKRLTRPWLYPDFIYKMTPDGKRFFQNCDYVHKVAEDVIEKRKRGLEKEGVPKVRHMDFLDILLLAKDEDGHAMTSQEIRSQVDSFMAAGHETTAAASPWFMHDLTSSTEWTDKCREEVDAILAGRDSEHILWSDLPGLQNLSLCFKESLRLHPTIPEIARELNEDMEIDGHVIPAGTPIHVTIMNLHMNHLIWDKPEEFNPDRMREENLKKIDNFAFAPFSAGPRNCIGKHFATNEMKTLLARILHRYILTIPPEAPAPDRKIETVLRSKDGLWFTIKRR